MAFMSPTAPMTPVGTGSPMPLPGVAADDGGGEYARGTWTVKDEKLMIEYKHLKKNSPTGVLVMPSLDNMRVWHGVIFVRRGMCVDVVAADPFACPRGCREN